MSAELPIGNGAFIGVVGPSGAGKDAVMRLAQEALAGNGHFHFAQRIITRPRDGIGEAHLPVSRAAFDLLRSENRLALHWEAHGNCYGIPIEIDTFVAAGVVVVANLSRTILGEMARRYAQSATVQITARPEILKQRLAARGRERESDIANRLARQIDTSLSRNTIVIDNSGALSTAGDQFQAVLSSHLRSKEMQTMSS